MKTIILAALLASVAGCNGTVTPAQVQAGTAGVELALCILDNAAVDTAAGMSAPAIVADLIAKCGTDVATVALVLADHQKLESAERVSAQKAAVKSVLDAAKR